MHSHWHRAPARLTPCETPCVCPRRPKCATLCSRSGLLRRRQLSRRRDRPRARTTLTRRSTRPSATTRSPPPRLNSSRARTAAGSSTRRRWRGTSRYAKRCSRRRIRTRPASQPPRGLPGWQSRSRRRPAGPGGARPAASVEVLRQRTSCHAPTVIGRSTRKLQNGTFRGARTRRPSPVCSRRGGVSGRTISERSAKKRRRGRRDRERHRNLPPWAHRLRPWKSRGPR